MASYITRKLAAYWRKEIWKHNSLSGQARWIASSAEKIANASSATPEARETAGQIAALAAKLKTQLSTRSAEFETKRKKDMK